VLEFIQNRAGCELKPCWLRIKTVLIQKLNRAEMRNKPCWFPPKTVLIDLKYPFPGSSPKHVFRQKKKTLITVV